MKEQWDAYDVLFRKTGTTLLRGEKIPDGLYHLVCNIAVHHEDGTWLLMKRDERKHLGGMWELSAGGAALAGETAEQCAIRELSEETGITAGNLTLLGTTVSEEKHVFRAEYLCLTSCGKNAVRLQEGETVDFRWVDSSTLDALGDQVVRSERIGRMLRQPGV